MLHIYNTLTRTKEEFQPLQKGRVSMYACGTTPYKPSHLGHAMQALIFDVARRYFEYQGYKVRYVRNYTDVDDKIIAAATKFGKDPLVYSRSIIRETEREFRRLRIQKPSVAPLVSKHIDSIIAYIEELLAKNFAYVTEEGNVYFRVKAFSDYGKLSRQKLEELQHGVRKEAEADKQDVLDFAVWKRAKKGEIFWKSPWGDGRPGWHIECSVMSMRHLGTHFDIHGGGGDLIFPHHENEIAQSASLHGHFANTWMHNGLLMVGNQKMSKSLGNDTSLAEWLSRYHPEVIRYMFLTNHYRSHVDFVAERYREANKKVYAGYKTLFDAHKRLRGIAKDSNLYQERMKAFEAAMDDDFNTVPVFVLLNASFTELNKKEKSPIARAHFDAVKTIGKVLGVFDLVPRKILHEMEDMFLAEKHLARPEITKKLRERNKLRSQKNFGEADALAKSLHEQGINIIDSPKSTSWEPRW